MLHDIEEMMLDISRTSGEIDDIIERTFPEGIYKLPSLEDTNVNTILSGFRLRQTYIKKFGFVFLSREFQEEVKWILDKQNIRTFCDIGAGIGAFTKFLNNTGFSGFGITLEIKEDDGHWWGMNPIYTEGVKDKYLLIEDLNSSELISPANIDMVVSCWTPLEGGIEQVNFLQNNFTNRDLELPQWYLNINEEGGCTGDINYWHYVNSNFEVFHIFEKYRSFSGLYDKAILYRRKSKN